MHGIKSSCTFGSPECICSDTPKAPLVSAPGCSDDLAAVLALPDQWTPRRCGPTLTNYLKERKCNHNKTLDDLTKQAEKVNKGIEDKIRELSEILLIHIEDNQKDMNCVIENSQMKFGPLCLEDRNDAHKQITNLFTQRIQYLVKYKVEAQSLERQRAESLKNVLQSHFHKLISIGHCSPKELLHDFDERMFEINQQLLSNSRAYTELEACLRAQLDEMVVSLRSSINQLCLTSVTRSRHQSASSWMAMTRENRFTRRSSSVDRMKRVIDSEPSHCMNIDLEEIQNCVSSLVETYRSTIVHMFDGFSGFLDKLHASIGNMNYFGKKDNLIFNMKDETDRAVHRISDSGIQLINFVKSEIADLTQNDVVNMQHTLCTLGDRLHSTYMILYDASFLLNPHMLRSALAQKLTVTSVEDMQTSYDILELANEVSFNISLEQLRSAPDMDKAKQLYDSIVNFLNKITETNAQHKECEMAKLEEFMILQPLLANTLLSEYGCFLASHPKVTQQRSESKNSTTSYCSVRPTSISSLWEPLPRVIMQTKLQDVALTNWKNGFLESFGNNIRFIPEELSNQARKWVDEKILLVNMRYSMKQMSDMVRYDRVQAALDIRLAELRLHETRLNDHLDAVYDLVNTLTMEASEFLALDAPELYPLCTWVVDIQGKLSDLLLIDSIDPEVKRLKMTSYAFRLTRHQHLFEESLDLAIEKFKKNVEARIQAARISNMQFMSKLKLFKEGGRYAAAEVIRSSSALVKAGDALEVCNNRTLEALNTRRSQLLALADQLLIPLRKVIDEVVKGSGKPLMDKKKLPPNKKK